MRSDCATWSSVAAARVPLPMQSADTGQRARARRRPGTRASPSRRSWRPVRRLVPDHPIAELRRSGHAGNGEQVRGAAGDRRRVGSAGGAAAASSKQPRSPLENTGRWLTDSERPGGDPARLQHGLQAAAVYAGAVGFGADDADFLRRNGFNTVRLGMIYKAVEPQPGRSTTTPTSASVRRTERTLAKRGISLADRLPPGPLQREVHGRGLARLGGARRRPSGRAADRLPRQLRHQPGLNRAFDNF